MNPDTLEAPAIAEPKVITLTAKDRCDLCGSQAYVSVLFETGELLFCAHHYKASAAKISETAVRVTDESWQLSDKRLDVSS